MLYGQLIEFHLKAKRRIMRAGTSKVNITPPVGLELSGWSFGKSVGILDELYAKVLLLESDGKRVLIITADLIGFNTEYADYIRKNIADRLNMNVSDILISCSHTHSGPATMFLRHWGEIDDDYVYIAEKQIIGAAIMASNNMRDASIGSGKGIVNGVCDNRRDGQNGSVDPEVGVIRVDFDGKMAAVLMNFSCHPVAAHNYKNMISADYPGYAMKVIESSLFAKRLEQKTSCINGDVTALHTTGTAGDINPKGLHDIKYAERFGYMIGGEALKVAESIITLPELSLSTASECVRMPVARLPEKEDLKRIIDESKQKIAQQGQGKENSDLISTHILMEWAQDALKAIEDGSVTDHLNMEIQAIRMNDILLIAIPGEVFVDIGLNIKKASPYLYTYVIEMANGSSAYLPTRKAFEKGGYELDFASKVYGIYAMTSDTQDVIENGAKRAMERVG